jgi:Lamin Tail Domain
MYRNALLLVLFATLALLSVPTVNAASPDVLVSQVFGGGGNAAAPFTNDYVELFNRGNATVDITGWTVQYATAAGASWQTTALTGSIRAGHYYLVQLASSAAVGVPLPAPDALGTTNLAVSGGKIALVRDPTPLTCGAAAGSCAGSALVQDLVGYGAASDFEGSAAAPALSSSTAAVRAGGGCVDTDSSSADFLASAPTPRTSTSAALACGSTTAPAPSTTQGATVDLDLQSLLSISLERPTLSFGSAAAGETTPLISEHVTVTSNNALGYALTVHRSTFQPSDLPLSVTAATAPAGGQLSAALAGGALVPVPAAPAADLLLGTATAAAGAGGDLWPLSFGFSALPAAPPGHYTASLTFTVIGR